MKAHDFEFDGKRLSSFGCVIANFDDKGLETISGVEITFNTIPSLTGLKHHLVSTVYESCLETTIQIVKYSCDTDVEEIPPSLFRELAKWLNKKSFKKFKILDEEHIDLYYMASIVSINRIELDGRLMGLELNITTNSPYALKEPRNIDVKLNEVYGWEEYKDGIWLGYVTSTNEYEYPHNGIPISDGYQRIYLGKIYKGSINDTSYEEGYIYPHTEITINQDGNLKIYNAIEDRDTYIGNCVAGEVITLDYPIIQSSVSSHNIQNDFNWNFFRVANTFDNSRNDLIVTLPCSIKIEYSPIVKVGL